MDEKPTKINRSLDIENQDTIYVYEKSVRATEQRIQSIKKSLENERTKAGVLLSFFFIVLVEGLEYFKQLPIFLKGVCFVLIILILYLLIASFCSKKMNEGVITNDNFRHEWKNKRGRFLKYYQEILENNVKNQKLELSKNSKRIRNAGILLGTVLIIILLNTNLPMFKILFDGEKENNPMSSDIQELNVKEQDIMANGGNPMSSDLIEKGIK